MNRDAAIEAGARALYPEAWDDDRWGPVGSDWKPQAIAQEEARSAAAAVIDAAAPHLVGEPVGYLVQLPPFAPLSDDDEAYRTLHAAQADARQTGGRVLALVPVEDQP